MPSWSGDGAGKAMPRLAVVLEGAFSALDLCSDCYAAIVVQYMGFT